MCVTMFAGDGATLQNLLRLSCLRHLTPAYRTLGLGGTGGGFFAPGDSAAKRATVSSVFVVRLTGRCCCSTDSVEIVIVEGGTERVTLNNSGLPDCHN